MALTAQELEATLIRIEGKIDYALRLLGHRPDELSPLCRVMAPRAWQSLRRQVDSIRALRYLSDEQLLSLPQFGEKALSQTHAFLAGEEVPA